MSGWGYNPRTILRQNLRRARGDLARDLRAMGEKVSDKTVLRYNDEKWLRALDRVRAWKRGIGA